MSEHRESLREAAPSSISVRGARVHNLRGIDVDIPHRSLVAVCGVSGSGKSSLAFDTVFAEGQRRYVESLSSYARQFLGQISKPDVDSIDGLSPAVSIDQKSVGHNPRSTVGTITEIWDYLRVLFARCGTAHCQVCSAPLQALPIDRLRSAVASEFADSTITICAPLVRSRKGGHGETLARAVQQGFTRVRVDGKIVKLRELEPLEPRRAHTIDLVVDRVKVTNANRSRLASSLETACSESGGFVTISCSDRELSYSTVDSCSSCLTPGVPLEPRSFSFNSPQGACPTCSGLGSALQPAADLIVPDPSLSVHQGAIAPWFESTAWSSYRSMVDQVLEHHGGDGSTAWQDLPEATRSALIDGDDQLQVKTSFGSGAYRRDYTTRFEGVAAYLRRRLRDASSDAARDKTLRFFQPVHCSECSGARLRPESRAVLFQGASLPELAAMPVGDLEQWCTSVQLGSEQKEVGGPLLREVSERLSFLVRVGLPYLSLDRAAATLSGGESQRIRLASQIGSALTGVLYVLDEPSIGLHQRDNHALIETLNHLRDLGNTVLVVEHDEDTVMSADHVVEIGPRAGQHGGRLVFSGSTGEFLEQDATLTAQFLTGTQRIATPDRRRVPSGELVLHSPRGNNLSMDKVSFPLGVLTVVTGVSGSGKSTLISDTLAPALSRRLHGTITVVQPHGGIDGLEQVSKIVVVDQSPIGRTPRSNPATYTGAFDKIRSLFSSTEMARARGYAPGRFSFNVPGGRCAACSGDGVRRVEMSFLPDVYVKCADCEGRRYNESTLEVHYRGKSIADVLDLTIEDALAFFSSIPALARQLQTLVDVGMGYVKLGQPATTLSGGEAQRVKLATELQRRPSGSTLYVLDEPTTGLHMDDVRHLLQVLNRLVDAGNTVVVVEHNLDVVRSADHVIDLGPQGGPGGGRVVACGTPEEVAESGSCTGEFLSAALERDHERALRPAPASPTGPA